MVAGAVRALPRAATAILLLAGAAGAGGALAQDLVHRDGFDPPPPTAPGAWVFQNVTLQSIDLVRDSSYRFDAAWTDFNSDGCYDPFIFNHSDPATSRLWLNRCDGSQRFDYVDNSQVRHYLATPSQYLGSGWMTLLDFNGDGRQDFFLRHASTPAARYLNGTPAGSFVPYFGEKQYGCDNPCSFLDLDGNGELDIANANRKVERMLARTQLLPAAGASAQPGVADLDGNGWPDLVQTDTGGYWRNNAGTLTWIASGFDGGLGQYALADFDNDGDIDVFSLVGDWTASSGSAQLYRNDGLGQFSDASAGAALAIEFAAYWTGYGNSIAADFDNDGLQDLLVAGSGYSAPVAMFRNLGGLRFAMQSTSLGPAGSGSESYKSRAAVADYDGDGRLDVVKTQASSNVGIWRNTTATNGMRWMKVRVRGPAQNSDGLGTDLRWYAAGTSNLLAHLQVQADSMHAQTWVHTGLGPNAKVDLVVRYPHGGPSRTHLNLDSNQEVVVYPSGCILRNWTPGDGWPLTAPVGC